MDRKSLVGAPENRHRIIRNLCKVLGTFSLLKISHVCTYTYLPYCRNIKISTDMHISVFQFYGFYVLESKFQFQFLMPRTSRWVISDRPVFYVPVINIRVN